MTEISTTAPDPAGNAPGELPHGGPSDMVPFESPSHWERLVLAIAVAGTLILAAVAGLGAFKRPGGMDVPAARVGTEAAASTSAGSR